MKQTFAREIKKEKERIDQNAFNLLAFLPPPPPPPPATTTIYHDREKENPIGSKNREKRTFIQK